MPTPYYRHKTAPVKVGKVSSILFTCIEVESGVPGGPVAPPIFEEGGWPPNN